MRPHRFHHNKLLNRSFKQKGEGSFVTSYTSLIIILLSFFIYLNSKTQPNLIKRNNVLKSISSVFGLNTKQSFYPEISNLDSLEKIDKIAADNNLAVSHEDNNSVLSLKVEELFQDNSYQLKYDAIPYLSEIIETARANELYVYVTVKINQDKNWNSSLEYAGSVFRFFVDNRFDSDKLFVAAKDVEVIANQEITLAFSSSAFDEMRQLQ